MTEYCIKKRICYNERAKEKPSIKLAQNENPEDAPSGFSALSRRAFHRLIAAVFSILIICILAVITEDKSIYFKSIFQCFLYSILWLFPILALGIFA